jgi:hypothetical protein
MRFHEAGIGVRVAVTEEMNDERSREVRCTYYERREGIAIFSPKFLPAYRLRTIQGGIDDETPRFDTGEHRTATEVPRTLQVGLADYSFWGKVP